MPRQWRRKGRLDMGQHRYNPTAQAAKRGELPPKPKKMGRRESDRWLRAEIMGYLMRKVPGTMGIISALGGTQYIER